MTIEPLSLIIGSAFCSVNRVPRALSQKVRWNCSSGILPRTAGSPIPALAHSTSMEPFSRLTGVVQAVQVVQFGRVTLDGGDVAADQLDGVVQSFLPPGLDEDVRPLLDEQFGAGQRYTRGSAGDHCNLAVELAHDHSVEPMAGPVGLLSKPDRIRNVPAGRRDRN